MNIKIIVFGSHEFMDNLQKEFHELDSTLYFINHYENKTAINLIALRVTNLTHILIDGDMYNDVDLYYAVKTLKLLNPDVKIICVITQERELVCHYLTTDELAYIVGTGIEIEHLFQSDFSEFNKNLTFNNISQKKDKRLRKKFYKTGYENMYVKKNRGEKNGRKKK